MVVKCRPFYLPREFTAIVIVTVYIPLCANTKDALCELYRDISEQQTNNPDVVLGGMTKNVYHVYHCIFQNTVSQLYDGIYFFSASPCVNHIFY